MGLSTMTNLQYFGLSSNKFSGTIDPEVFTKLVDLKYVDLYNNSFTGSIPTTFGTLEQLSLLYLQDNSFEGSVPLDLCSGNLGALANLAADCLFKLVALNVTNGEKNAFFL